MSSKVLFHVLGCPVRTAHDIWLITLALQALDLRHSKNARARLGMFCIWSVGKASMLVAEVEVLLVLSMDRHAGGCMHG